MDDSLLTNFPTKERSVNFTQAELERLQSLIAKHQNILFCKKTDGISAKQKEHAWGLIQCEFNAVGDTPRTVKQLKYKFENLKRAAKKEATKERQEMRRTGGGPPPVTPESKDTTDWLRSIMSTSIDGNPSVYDDDVIILPGQKILFPEIKPKEKKKIYLDSEDAIHEMKVYNNTRYVEGRKESIESIAKETVTADLKENGYIFDTSTPHSSLKRPLSSPLKRKTIASWAKKQKTDNNCNLIRQKLGEKKLSVMEKLNEHEIEKIKDSIRHAQEIHDQTLRHKEEQHKLVLEKLNLEIAILKNTLDKEL